MKEKLELKHLSAYLAYGLKGAAYSIDGYYEPIELGELMRIETGITRSGDTGEVWLVLDDIEVPIIEFKPILYPLKYLTKEIEVNGEKFVPLEFFDCEDTKRWLIILSETKDREWALSYLGFFIVQKLLQLHFDIFGLIEKGLAIDINTLKK
jgi:hypothetical protein